MRGDDRQPDAMFSYISAEQRVPSDHPLRAVRRLVDDVLAEMSREFDGLYATVGRPSVPPQDRRVDPQGKAARARQRRLAVCLRLCRVQPAPPPTAAGEPGVRQPPPVPMCAAT